MMQGTMMLCLVSCLCITLNLGLQVYSVLLSMSYVGWAYWCMIDQLCRQAEFMRCQDVFRRRKLFFLFAGEVRNFIAVVVQCQVFGMWSLISRDNIEYYSVGLYSKDSVEMGWAVEAYDPARVDQLHDGFGMQTVSPLSQGHGARKQGWSPQEENNW